MKKTTIILSIPDDNRLNLVKLKRLIKRKLSAEYKIIQPTGQISYSKDFINHQ